MFEIGWQEILVVMVIALVVIGPKDLPKAIYTMGKWVRKARLVARDFQSNIDDMMRETELEELRNQMRNAGSLDVKDQIEKTIDPKGELKGALTLDDLADDISKPADALPAPAPAPAPAAAPAPAPVPTPTPAAKSAAVADTATPQPDKRD